jgi:uncharacterized protein YjbI with pentapeptide repeats
MLPYFQVNYQGITNNTEKATLENQYRATLAQISGGVAIGIGLYYTWRRITIAEEDLKATQENLKVAQENLKVSQESQITERFTRAVEQLGAIDQLGNPAIEIRLGGIYALERISNESKKDYWPIMEILTAYVRKNSRVENQPNEIFLATGSMSMDIQANESIQNKVPEVNILSLDIEAVLTVLGRRKYRYMDEKSKRLNLMNTSFKWLTLSDAHFEVIDFSNARFEGAVLTSPHFKWAELSCARFEHGFLIKAHFEHAILFATRFEKVNFIDAYFEGARLEETHFEGSDLEDVHFERVDITEAHFKGASMITTHFEEANLTWVHFEGASLIYAHFEGANLKGVHLEGANLRGVHFEGANLLEETNFKGANLEGANLEGANLEGAINLTINQLSKVKTLYNAKLDKELEIPLREKYPALFEKPDQDET